MKRVLFLCTANYYRSRFAEHLFNHHAAKASLSWRADSRGLLVGHWGNIGPISHFTTEALQMRSIPIPSEHREPMPLTRSDLDESHLVVAVKETEHRGLMASQFPDWTDTVEYWHIDDIDCATPDESLPCLEQKVLALVDRLAAADRQSDRGEGNREVCGGRRESNHRPGAA